MRQTFKQKVKKTEKKVIGDCLRNPILSDRDIYPVHLYINNKHLYVST